MVILLCSVSSHTFDLVLMKQFLYYTFQNFWSLDKVLETFIKCVTWWLFGLGLDLINMNRLSRKKVASCWILFILKSRSKLYSRVYYLLIHWRWREEKARNKIWDVREWISHQNLDFFTSLKGMVCNLKFKIDFWQYVLKWEANSLVIARLCLVRVHHRGSSMPLY